MVGLPGVRLRYRLSNSLDHRFIRGELNEAIRRTRLDISSSYADLTRCLRGFSLPKRYVRSRGKLRKTTCSILGNVRQRGIMCTRVHFTPLLSRGRDVDYRHIVRTTLGKLSEKGGSFNMRYKLVIYTVERRDRRRGEHVLRATERFLNTNIYTTSLTNTRIPCPVSNFVRLFGCTGRLKLPFAVRTKRYKGTRGVVSTIRSNTTEVNRKVTVENRNSVRERLSTGNVNVRLYPVDGLRAGTITSTSRCPVERFLSTKLGIAVGASGHAMDGAALSGRLRFVRGACNVHSRRLPLVVGGTLSITFTSSTIGRQVFERLM